MKTSDLAMLIELASTARDTAGARRAQAAAAVDLARRQLATLRGYAADYAARGRSALARGADVAAQANQRAFAAKLEQAVTQQEGELRRCEQALVLADRNFIEAQRKVKSLQALQTRGAERQRQQAQRREQKTVDEVAQTMLGAADNRVVSAGW